MVSEFIIGRYTHKNTADAYRQLAPGTGWVFQGYLGVFTSWFILCYYSVVAGWTLKYLVEAVPAGDRHLRQRGLLRRLHLQSLDADWSTWCW